MADELAAVQRQRGPLSAGPAWWFFGAGVTAMLIYAAAPTVATSLVLAVACAAIAAVFIGLRRNEAGDRRRPWYALAAGMTVFLLGEILRAVVPGATANPPGLAAMITDASVLPGYLAVGYGLLDMLRRRRGADDRLARSDGLLIGLGAAVATWSLWFAPRLESHLSGAPQMVSTAYPLVDVMLLVLVIRLMVADGKRQPALWFLMATMGLIFVIDLIYAIYADGASTAVLVLFNVGFGLAYTTLGAAALHPTMRSLSDAHAVVTRTIGAARIAGITTMVMAPVLCAYLIPTASVWNQAVRVALAGLLSVTIGSRIVRSQASQALAEAAARHRSTHDMLTELPNRELLTDTITAWCARPDMQGKEISLLFIDLDRFKHFNDNWGHRVGDELLCAVAGRLAAMVRAEDLVCRIGGDEFVLAMASSAHSALAQSVAERVVEEFRQPFPISISEVFVSPSIGVACARGATEAIALIRDADLAMYAAKGAGGNTYAVFDESLRDRARTRVEIEQALRGAHGRGELSVHYQPIVAADTGEVTGFEALMRWTHPVLGAVSPDKFIPVAEMTGLIIPSGAWLLDEAVDQLDRWHRDRRPDLPPLHMSVNIATRQLHDPDLVDRVRRALHRTGLPASSLWLEITESVMLTDAAQSQATLARLRDLGVTLCIDDFGTGFASLSYLDRIPARIVKIDRSFINRIGGNDTGDDTTPEAIVVGVIAMTHAVGRQVVAEGVETPAQRAWLVAQGCDYIQGWLFGRAEPAATQDAWHKERLEPLTTTTG